MNLLMVNWENAFVVVGLGFGMVLIILYLLVVLLNSWSKLSVLITKIHKTRKEREENELKKQRKKINLSVNHDDDVAAISLALYLYFNQHDKESNVITIKRIERRYSPWSSKIHGMNNF